MNATPVAVNEKSGEHIRPTLGPLNRSEEPRFGVVDVVIIGFFLVFTGSLISLVTVLLAG